jgi:hypothetical protein
VRDLLPAMPRMTTPMIANTASEGSFWLYRGQKGCKHVLSAAASKQ